jgi:hypothetical protein
MSKTDDDDTVYCYCGVQVPLALGHELLRRG